MENKTEKTANVNVEPGKKSSFHFPRILTLVAIILGLLFEILFDGHPVGISFPIWITACTLALIGMAWMERIQPANPEYLLSIPIIVLSIFTCFRLEPMTGILSMLVTLVLLGIWVYAFRIGRIVDFGWLDFAFGTIRSAVEPLFHPWPVASIAWRETVGARGARSSIFAVLRGIILALPVFLIFLGLLVSADLIFADYVENALQWLDIEVLARLARRLLVVFFFSIFSLGAIVMALREREGRQLIGLEKPILAPFVGFIESSVILILIDLLFIAFVVVQFAYLFGGEANITAAGYNYSEYARRGFFELTILAVLSLGLIMGLGFWAKRENIASKRWFNAMSTCLVAMMVVILASALKRLMLYEAAYGFTRLRTYTHVAIGWMGVMFVVFIILLYQERLRRFAPAAVLGLLGFTLTLNILNVDAFIVRQNLKRYAATGDIEIVQENSAQNETLTGKLDLRYLFDLSYDAIPGLVDFVDEAKGEIRTELLAQLSCEREKLDSRMQTLKWPSLHISPLRAQKMLGGIDELLDEYPVTQIRDGWEVEVDGEPMYCYRDFSWD